MTLAIITLSITAIRLSIKNKKLSINDITIITLSITAFRITLKTRNPT
jgi:hypothetical protein